jgi:hypothetical protein
MYTNKDTKNLSHKVANYFQINKSKKAILHLIYTNKTRVHISDEEKD